MEFASVGCEGSNLFPPTKDQYIYSCQTAMEKNEFEWHWEQHRE